MNKIIETLEKARLLESFCGHDLRGEVGRCISFLGLLRDQLPPDAPEDFREMIDLSFKSAQTALEQLDTRLGESSLETRYVWVYSKTFPAERNILSDADAVVLRMNSLETLLEARGKYRPDFVFIDGSDSSYEEWRTVVEAIGSPLTKTVLLVAPDQLQEAASCEHVEVHSLSQIFDIEAIKPWLRA